MSGWGSSGFGKVFFGGGGVPVTGEDAQTAVGSNTAWDTSTFGGGVFGGQYGMPTFVWDVVLVTWPVNLRAL